MEPTNGESKGKENGKLKGNWGCIGATYSRAPGIQIIPTSGPKVCRCYLHWAIFGSPLAFFAGGMGVGIAEI